MMYYSYLYDQKWQNILSYFHYTKKMFKLLFSYLHIFFLSILNYWKNYEFHFLGLIAWKVKKTWK